jgi:phosphatidylglycerol:prolipoprotein diacylglycerol transferase
VHFYGVCVVLGAAAGIALTVGRAARLGLGRFDALAAALLAFSAGLVGAAALFAAVHGGLGLVFFGGLAGGALGAMLYARAYHIELSRFADAAAPGLAVGQGIGRLGCFAAGCCYGRPDAGPLALDGRYPVQLLEAALLFSLGGALLRLVPTRPSLPIALYLGGHALLRLFTERLRGDDLERGLRLGALYPSQLLGGVALVVAAGLLYRVFTRGA